MSIVSTRWLVPVMLLLGVVLMACSSDPPDQSVPVENQSMQQQETAAPTDTPEPTLTSEPTQTPQPSDTPMPTNTLRPPPTDEPPTPTPTATTEPTETAIPTVDVGDFVNELGLRGLNTETPEPGEEGPCVPNPDWTLVYEVGPGDALGNIAPRYNTTVDILAEGNCIEDPSLIRLGQRLRVPGDAQPVQPEFVCVPWELLAPFNGTITVPGVGALTFAWRGPDAPRNLVRIYTQNGDGTYNQVFEKMVEFTQETTVDLSEIPAGGTYFWNVFPLGSDFSQIPCQESYISQFTKAEAPAVEEPAMGGPGAP